MNGSLRVCTVVGARPQFVEAAVVSRALARAGIAEALVRAGQHYDAAMNEVCFSELEFDGLGRLGQPVLLPLRPRTRGRLADPASRAGQAVRPPANLDVREPASYLAMLTPLQHARCVLADSGGLREEAFWLDVPCVTLRDETEWTKTLEGGWNRLAGASPDAIAAAAGRPPDMKRTSGFDAVPSGTASDAVAAHVLAALPTETDVRA